MAYYVDIAISYKSEMEKTAKRIKDYLVKDGWNVFYAPASQQEVLSENIHQKLYSVYKNESCLKVLLISASYLEGEWTSLEKRISLESTKEDRKRLLIVNYIERDLLPEELRALVCLDGRKMREDEIACLITERLNMIYNKDKEEGRQKEQKREKEQTCTIINHGIIAGDNAHFGKIEF
ncbi:MAG: toll/interleukin-1 receptor domain-containing protein [Lachnospiraceae bacterium]|nr:toll/interleukin-1 receptor domain-containing protein [Lachnospiraceae bacterium]